MAHVSTTESGSDSSASEAHKSEDGAQSPTFLRQIAGAVDRGLRVIRAAASAIVEDDTESDVLATLIAHHRQVEKLFGALEPRGTPADRRQALVGELTEALVMHAAVEEMVFYPGVRVAETESLVLESFEEHLAMKRTLLDLNSVAPSDDTFAAKLSTLKEMVIHHAKQEEEAKLFPILRRLLSLEQREAMAQELIAAMVEVSEGPAPLDRLRAEIEAASPH